MLSLEILAPRSSRCGKDECVPACNRTRTSRHANGLHHIFGVKLRMWCKHADRSNVKACSMLHAACQIALESCKLRMVDKGVPTVFPAPKRLKSTIPKYEGWLIKPNGVRYQPSH